VSDQVQAFLEAAGGVTYPLKAETNTLGRAGGGASIEIRDKSLSRQHAEIRLDEGKWLLRDLNSRNKTFLNEKPIPPEEPRELTDGDQVHFGAYALHFRMGGRESKGDIDATMALDVGQLPFDDMFIKAGMKSKADGDAGNGAGAKPGATPQPAAPPDGSNLTQNAFAVLELRSVTSKTKYYLTKTTVRIGSDPTVGCDIVIPEPGIEAKHVEIKFMGGRKIRMRNLSTSGTLVNGKRSGNISINDGDTIEIGDCSFTFRVLKLPEGEESPRKRTPLVLVGAVVAVLALGAFGYYVATQVGEEAEATQATAGGATAQATPAPSVSGLSVQRAIEEVRRLEFSNAVQTAATVANEATDQATRSRAQSIKNDLDLLLTARAQVDNRLYLDARATLLSIPSGEVRDLAGDEIRRIDMICTQFVNTTIAQIRDAESREQWSQALTHLDALRGNPEGLSIDPSRVRQRIELKRRASEELRLAQGSPLIDTHELTMTRVANLLSDIETRVEQNPALADDLDHYIRELKNVSAHSELVKEYLAYKGGDMGKIREIDARIHPGYPSIRDVRRIVTNAERIQRMQASYESMMAELEGMPHGSESVARQQQLIQNRQDILSLETSPKFQLATDARADLRRLQDFRTQMIVAKWREAPPQGQTEDRQQLLTSHVEARRHAYEVLSLFEGETRRRIQSASDIILHIAEPDLQAVYQAALESYNSSFTRATAVLYEAIVDPNPALASIRDQSVPLSAQLRDATLPEDENSRRQLDRLREQQLRSRSR